MTERRAYRLTGRVQGVGFRWWARDAASRLGLRGVVRNEPDGSVWLEAKGEGARLDQFEQLLGTGPPGARVEEVREEPPTGHALPSGFEIGH